MSATPSAQLNPFPIIQVGLSFWSSKTLLAATKLGLFTHLSEKPLTAEQIKQKLGLNQKGLYVRDFLDALYSMGFLERTGSGESVLYQNTPDTAAFLDKNQPAYLGGFLEMANDREYKFWGDLEEGLKTGNPQNEIKYTGKESFEAIYDNPISLAQFTEAMSGIQKLSFMAFANSFDFSGYKTLVDAGGSAGLLSALVAQQHPHMHCTTFDLPQLEPFAKATAETYGVADRVTVLNGDFFNEPFPTADVVTMGNILHSFDLEKKKMLLQKAYEALPANGCLVIIEMILDNERRENTFGLLMSLNMLIESDGGFNYTQNEFRQWVSEAGFTSVKFIPLGGPVSAAVAYK
ncbi:Ubiquinone/menaquinone biosynthesis C-methylase UbiE [Catalinimonas alkaloidigena]|uniref:Ubiquinone/menaquinone biosynthesis C-methylase UbiE n=1 Tax=Catalinimonas alkaloidigena TaxID=1075417 RepID=A0A1G8XPA8_9BACT|nr:methyltransferase [Catalinimonas alkaloidigena]SDJ92439.1 Ubiquinone/menaquinone biosynthesis C-methylase UbiE [Catalinimonas alkaloidigena]